MSGLKKLTAGNTNFIHSPFYIKYGIPLLLLVWVTLLKLMLFTYMGISTPFLLYFAVIVITARYFGEIVAMLIILCMAVLVNFFFLYPYNAFSVDADHLTQTGLFILECSFIVGLSAALRRTVKKMHQRDMLFKALVEKSTEGITMHNAEGVRIYCSPSVEAILGYTLDELARHQPWELSHESEVLYAKEQFYRLASHPGKTVIMLHRVKHKNGKWIWLESRLTNLLHEPMVNAIISNFTDVTDRVNLEKQREDFIGVASHELKTPLTSLKAFTQVLENRFRGSTDTSSHEIITKIDHQVNRIVRMINDMLDVSSLQAGAVNFNIAKFDLNDLVVEISQSLQHTTKKHRIDVNLDPVAAVPGDRERIGQVVNNFITNAIKYSPDESVISITSKVEEEQVTISVQDYGIGIPKDEQKSIFEKFYRVGNSQKAFQGLGLGLFICYQIIELHKGKIGVISEPGKGSTFWFSLPL
ncbi:ATP-binding protein [Mucilaginibacter sp. AW1-3]